MSNTTPSFTEQKIIELADKILCSELCDSEDESGQYWQGDSVMRLLIKAIEAASERIAELEKQLSTIEQKAFEDLEADGMVFCGKCGHQK